MKMKMCARAAGLALVCAAGLPAAADLEPRPIVHEAGVLSLRTGAVEVSTLENLKNASAVPFDSMRHVIMLDGPMTRERRDALDEAGVIIEEYLPTHAYLVDLSASQGVRGLEFVTWIGAWRDDWKIDPEIGLTPFTTAERIQVQSAGRVRLVVHLFAGADLDAASRQVTDAGGFVAMNTFEGVHETLDVEIDAAGVGALASIAEVQYVETYPEITFRNDSVRWVVQTNVNGSTPLYDNGVTGTGQLIGHMDGRIGSNHCSFRDLEGDPIGDDHRKIQEYNTSIGFDFHGTHTAATAAGNPTDGHFDDSRGVAYDARLVHDVTPGFGQSSMYNNLTLHMNQGAFVHTNSWGNDSTTSYDGLSRAIDNFSWQNEDQLVFFAATNLSTLKNPENAKNVVAVGGSGDSSSSSSFCTGGRGPTNDGRRKPEIFSPGCGIRSANSNSGCSTSSATGTSMACPSMTGTAALVRQYFEDGYYPTGGATPEDGFVPSGPLVKATLLNSAVDMTGVSGYPSNQEGWGRVKIADTLYFDGDSDNMIASQVRMFDDGALFTGDTWSMDFEVTSSLAIMKATMAYHDAPASIGANPATVNDLDLVLISPSGVEYRGNNFSGGLTVPGGSSDTKNTVEQCHVGLPELGVWTAEVRGAELNLGLGGFGLVISGPVETLPECAIDINGDTVTDIFDVLAFISLFDGADPSADWNGDTILDIFDVLAYLDDFTQGC